MNALAMVSAASYRDGILRQETGRMEVDDKGRRWKCNDFDVEAEMA